MIQHEIQHGDCRDLIAQINEPVHCVVTDPPYGVDFVSRRAVTPQGKEHVAAVANDDDLAGALKLFHDVMNLLLPKCADVAELYVFTRWDIVDSWIRAMRQIGNDHGFAYKMLLVWAKGIPGMGDIDSNWGCGHELILYCKRGRREVPYRRSGIITVDKVANMKHVHPTEKPVALLETLIEMSTDPDELVVDPFSGSGSTILAAKNLGRRGLGMELEDKYVQVSRARLEQGVFA